MEPHPATDSLIAAESAGSHAAGPGPAAAPPAPGRPPPPLLRDYLDAFLVAVICALFVRTFLIQAFVIPSRSMEGNLLVGDRVLVNRFLYTEPGNLLERLLLPVRPVERGDVVVFRYPPDPTRDYVKRCVATGGDRLALYGRRLEINGQEVAEPYLDPPAAVPAGVFGPVEVPGGTLFCLGDNRDNSEDSRVFGPVPVGNLRGRALLVYWSTDPAELPAQTLARAVATAPLRSLAATRWSRCLRPVR